MDARLLEHIYTIEDIYELPEGTHAELIDGELFMMAAPSTKHQRIVSELHYLLKDYIKKNHGSCEVFPSPFAVFLNADYSIYLEPDLSVICDKKKLTDKGCYGAPDWIIEIVSPTSRQRDYNKKLFKYHSAGVREYWIADYSKNRIMVYYFDKNQMEEYSFTDQIKAGIFENLEINFSEISLE